ncbi:sigma-70 family RNA polymerase sigma factor [Dyadobacter chenwenxiniae]|uniref:Sigma-70 family RNA polymerase sigma factor n=1 Tax=Dyadobacter chenwenxiniae TaxID=2906456 RepID=A0A9X1TDE1_9BACT|nr:sigma-70 family RNA polymerase sigma factor [Dyadobacter chenwenxiniae]MCF0060235.1 sigma-70 family RNA polymerase sigma factor [Dyadobacter chenwenxiniae]UON85973.1 sigma-70 family RNA polymerase sigma factor [Dyadobacter chenwenxiniae]
MPHISALHQETELLISVSQGDERAFTALYNHYHKRLGTHIYRITKSTELAEEVVHDVFLKIWLNRETLVNVENFSVYLYVISKNAALNCLKRTIRERALTTELDTDSEQVSLPDTPEDDYRYILIDEAIDRLPPQQRQAYLLARHERLSYVEVALRMNLSKETVKKYLQIATEFISAYIGKRLMVSIWLTIQNFL